MLETRVDLEDHGVAQSGIPQFPYDPAGRLFTNLQHAAVVLLPAQIHSQRRHTAVDGIAVPRVFVAGGRDAPPHGAAKALNLGPVDQRPHELKESRIVGEHQQ